MNRNKQHQILSIDDDPEFNRLIQVFMNQLNVTCTTVTTSYAFIENLENSTPDLCLVDLNLGLSSGFELIKKVRETFKDLPVIVISGISDGQSIAHALEVGANDYIVKPIDPEFLASKLSKYIQTDSILEHEIQFFPIPGTGIDATIFLDFTIEEIDEFGLLLTSQHLIVKGTVLRIQGDFFKEIFENSKTIYVTVMSTSIDPVYGFKMYAEFNDPGENFLTTLRHWLLQKTDP